MPLPDGAPSLQVVWENLERGLRLRRVGEDPKPKPGFSIVFVRRNGSGKHELCVQHPTGTADILSTEP
jgi:hypothetical protein